MSQSTPTAIFPFCGECGTPERTLTKPLAACDRCCTVFYCSKECQENDWIYHQRTCNTIRAMTTEDDDIPYLSLDDTTSTDDTSPETSPICSSPRDEVPSYQDTKYLAYGSLLDDYFADSVTSIEKSPSSIKRAGLLTPIRSMSMTPMSLFPASSSRSERNGILTPICSVPITPMSLSSASSSRSEDMAFSDNEATTARSTPRTSLDAMSSTEREQSDITTPLLRHLSVVEDEKHVEGRRKEFLREILNQGFSRAVDYIVDAIYEEPPATSTRVY